MYLFLSAFTVKQTFFLQCTDISKKHQPLIKYLYILFRDAPLFCELLLCGVSACEVHILPQTLHGARGGLYCDVVVDKQLRKIWQAAVGHFHVGFSLG